MFTIDIKTRTFTSDSLSELIRGLSKKGFFTETRYNKQSDKFYIILDNKNCYLVYEN